jgi:hypothetical protein
MNPLNSCLFVFACAFGGALLGMGLRRLLPDHHIAPESKEVVRVGMGLVATMVALVLGLLVYSAKGFFDTQTNEVTQLAANVVFLDRILAHYGPEAAEVRAELRHSIERQIDIMWSENGGQKVNVPVGGPSGEVILDKIRALNARDDSQKLFQSQAMSLALQMGQMRTLMYMQRSVPVPKALLVMLIFWVIALFASFGLFAPSNTTVIGSLFVAAAAVCGAVFLLVEMYYPYGGLIQVSSAPLHAALAQLGK